MTTPTEREAATARELAEERLANAFIAYWDSRAAGSLHRTSGAIGLARIAIEQAVVPVWLAIPDIGDIDGGYINEERKLPWSAVCPDQARGGETDANVPAAVLEGMGRVDGQPGVGVLVPEPELGPVGEEVSQPSGGSDGYAPSEPPRPDLNELWEHGHRKGREAEYQRARAIVDGLLCIIQEVTYPVDALERAISYVQGGDEA